MDGETINQFKQWVEQHDPDVITFQEAADRFGVSLGDVLRLCLKAGFGCTLKEKIVVLPSAEEADIGLNGDELIISNWEAPIPVRNTNLVLTIPNHAYLPPVLMFTMGSDLPVTVNVRYKEN